MSPGIRAAVAIVSAPGRGAIGIVQLRGPDAPGLVSSVFPAAPAAPETSARHGTFVGGDGEAIDDGLVLRDPSSVEPLFLLTLHGNPLLLEQLVTRLVDLGASREEPDGRAWWPPDRGDRVAREAMSLLPRARTAGAAAFLLSQAGPGLSTWARHSRTGPAAPDEIATVLARAPRGRGLIEPRRVVLAGVTNAGKSTLFNQLLRSERVVTHPRPGTTRDLIEEETSIGAYPVRLVDGAGLRDTDDGIEGEGIRRMREAIAEADLVLLLEPPEDGNDRVPAVTLPRRQGITLRIRSRADQIRPGVPGDGGLRVSGLTGEGVEALRHEILRALFGHELPPTGPTPFLVRHEAILERALEGTRRGEDPRKVLEEL